MLERGQEISKREWKLIRVAIVAMENSTYIGRLFFGDKETGEVVWDCDCRPSDGMWLSFQVSTDITQQNASIRMKLAEKAQKHLLAQLTILACLCCSDLNHSNIVGHLHLLRSHTRGLPRTETHVSFLNLT